MKASNHISEELSNIAPGMSNLAEMAGFSIPESYFTKFYDRLLIKIASDRGTYQVPQDYFINFPKRLLERIVNEEEANIEHDEYESPLLTSLKNKSTFKVPEGYFDNLKTVTSNKEEAVVRPMFSNRFMWKQVAAAVITGVIAVNAFWNFNQADSVSSKTGENAAFASTVNQSKQFRSEDQINEGIAQLSGDDIAKYLAFNSSESDIENVISNINDNDLPVQDPAISDEKAINNYLNN